MKIKLLLLLTAGGLVALTSPVSAETKTRDEVPVNLPAARPAPDAAELTKLLKDFLAGASRNDVAMHERFWASDLIYTASTGQRFGKAQLMREVRAETAAPATDEKSSYTAEDIRIQQYGTTAIVAFRLVSTTTKGGKTEVQNYFNTGTFLKRDGKWQAVSWQATKIPTTASK
jgi:hypothetical protein